MARANEELQKTQRLHRASAGWNSGTPRMSLGHCGWSLLIRSFAEFYGEHSYCISIPHRLVDMEGNLGSIRMVRVRCDRDTLTRGMVRIDEELRKAQLLGRASAGWNASSVARALQLVHSRLRARGTQYTIAREAGLNHRHDACRLQKKRKDSLYPAWCGGRSPGEKRYRAILGKFSAETIAEAEASARLDLVRLLHASSFDGPACGANYDA